MKQSPHANWRMPAGVGLMLAIIVGWAMLVDAFMAWIGPIPEIVRALLYLVAGIIWILPLRPLMIWMNRGNAPSDD